MIIGRLRHYVELQSCTVAQNNFGEESKTWSTDENIYAQIEPLRGQQLLEYSQINAEVTHKITIWYTSNATPEKRIKWGTRIFDISVSLNMNEKGEMQELLCKEKL